MFASNYRHNALPFTNSVRRSSIGFAADLAGTPQVGLASRNNNGAASAEAACFVSSGRVGAELGSSAASYQQEIAFAASGFTATQKDHDGGGNQDIWGYLVFDLGDQSFWVGIVDAPISTTEDWTVAGPGFEPQAGGLILSNVTAAGTYTDSGAGAECLGITAFDAATSYSAVGAARDAAAPSTASLGSGVVAPTLGGLQTDVHLLSGKPTLNPAGWGVPAAQIATADATARKWIAFAIEAEAAVPAGNAPAGLLIGDLGL